MGFRLKLQPYEPSKVSSLAMEKVRVRFGNITAKSSSYHMISHLYYNSRMNNLKCNLLENHRHSDMQHIEALSCGRGLGGSANYMVEWGEMVADGVRKQARVILE